MRLLLLSSLLLALVACDDTAGRVTQVGGNGASGTSGTGSGGSSGGTSGGELDAGPVDAGPVDAGRPDAGLPDAGRTDAGSGLRVIDGIAVAFGADVDPSIQQRVLAHLRAVTSQTPTVIPADELVDTANASTLLLAFGETALTRDVLPLTARDALPFEAYRVKAKRRGPGTLLVADGRPAEEHAHGNLGLHHGIYAALEQLGFAFLHPLAPTRPQGIAIPLPTLDLTESPRWKERTIHLHTQHPLELTELLQGWGPGGPNDAAGWAAMKPEWDSFLEWLVANRQNGAEWFLLWADSWSAFADSTTRITRIKELVDRGHAFGLAIGLDAPIAFGQQHSYRLLRTSGGTLAAELAEIRGRLDYVLGAGFDFLGIESGTSEFTAPQPDRMLAWMNEVAAYADTRWHAKAFIKVHCSTGQTAAGQIDPTTGRDVNFNFLPRLADARLGVLPHTVQHYGLTDPAPTYGNTDFAYIRTFLRQEAGSRPTVWYPETAYWVSFDVDVPLFLPLYAERRLHDLRLLASDEDARLMGRGAHVGAHMDGQLVFSSGWEWGYWLNDVIAARSAWNPRRDLADDTQAYRQLLRPVLSVFGTAAADVETWIVDVTKAEQALLIEGRVNGVPPTDIDQRNGQAYLQGSETWDDVNDLAVNSGLGPLVRTQPDKLGLVDMRTPGHGGPGYSAEVEPLLAEMELTFATLSTRAEALRTRIPVNAKPLFDDLADAMKMTALRAQQVHGLYDYVDGYWDTPNAQRRARLQTARDALDAAIPLVRRREAAYRVPVARIAGWRNNPTAYEYGYLWTVHSLMYWWRDEGKAVDVPRSPCYLNITNPADVALGEGVATDLVRLVGGLLSSTDQRGCLAEPSSEPTYPQDDLRSHP